jgi:hypothetical protein
VGQNHAIVISYPQKPAQSAIRARRLLNADSDDLARVYRLDLAQDSEMISPTIPG